MAGIVILVFAGTLVATVGLYAALAPARGARQDVRRRLSLLEIRHLRGDAEIPDVLREEVLSAVPPLNRLLERIPTAARLDRRLKQADLDVNPGAFLLLTGLLFAGGLAAGLILHGPAAVAILLGGCLAFLPSAVVNARRRRRLHRFTNHFPEALEMFARSLRAGHSFTGAIQLVAQEMPKPVGPEFRKVFDEQNMGIPLKQALLGMAERVDSMDVKFFVTAILIQRDTGGNLAEIIDKIAYVIRERFRIQGQLKVFTAQARMTGLILAFLPVGVALVVGALNPDYLKPLWNDSVGRALVGVAVAMQVVGMLLIRKIIRIKI